MKVGVSSYSFGQYMGKTGANIFQVIDKAKEPTCTEVGNESYSTCTRCDYTTYAEIPAKGHSYSTAVIPPTCVESGYTVYPPCRKSTCCW